MHNRTHGARSTHAKVGEGFRLELVDSITVPQWLYDAYIMGNEYSGHLTMTEQEKLADFKAQFDKYHLDNHDEEAQYCGTNEFDGMGGLCYDVDVYKRSSDEAKKNEDVATVAGDLSAPAYAYIGESGSGKDRRIKLEGSTLFDKLLSLRKAGTYTSIGPAEGSREWNKLDAEDQKFYKGLQAKAKKLSTYKAMGDFLSKLCSENECFLFAIRQGDDAVWVNPKATKELLDSEWYGTDKNWIEDACGVWAYHKKEFAKWKKRFGRDESAGIEFTNGNEAKGETMDFEKYYKEFEKEAKKLLSAELWDKACAGSDPKGFAKDLFDAEFEPGSAAEEFAEMVQTMKEQGEFGEAKCEGEHECEWCVEYEDVWDNKECEKFPTESEAWARYNELLARTHGDMADIVWVEEPKCPTCECGSSAASLGAVPTGGSQVKDEGKDEFLKDALYRINFDGDEEIVAKLIKDGEDFSLVALMPDGKAKAVKTADLFSVVDYCKELLDMDAEDAIIIIENA